MAELMTIPMASQQFTISASTLRKWIKTGKLVAFDKTLGKRRPIWLVKTADILRLLGNHQSHAPRGRMRATPRRAVLTPELLRSWGVA